MLTQRDQLLIFESRIKYLEDKIEQEVNLRKENADMKLKIERLEKQVKHLIKEINFDKDCRHYEKMEAFGMDSTF